MVQVLQPREGFGQGVAKGLGAGLSAGIGQELEAGRQARLLQAKEEAKTQKHGELLKSFGFKGAGDQLTESSGKFPKLSHEQKAMLALTDPTAFKAYEQLESGIKEEEEKAQKKENLTGILKGMSETLLEGNLGYTPAKYATAQGRRDAQYFDSLGVQLESIGKEMVSKGVLSAPRFAYLLSNLPSANKSDATNAGAIEAWADELNLPRPEGLESLYKKKSKKPQKKAEKQSSKSVAFQDAQGNVYDIPLDMAEEARKEGLKPL